MILFKTSFFLQKIMGFLLRRVEAIFVLYVFFCSFDFLLYLTFFYKKKINQYNIKNFFFFILLDKLKSEGKKQ